MAQSDVVLVFGILYFLSLAGILSVFLFNPVAVWLVSRFSGERPPKELAPVPDSASMIVVTRNAGKLIEDKIQNSLSLRGPAGLFEIIICSDGSTDDTAERARQSGGDRVCVIESTVHEGKHAGMNAAVAESRGEILVFTDADAVLAPDSLDRLMGHFTDPAVGGACGLRVIAEEGKELKEAQSAYIGFDSYIKLLESKIGSISSNDGKLYAVRRELFVNVPPAVTDDLYVSLSVIRQGRKFIYEPEARAFIRVPSRGRRHEVERRRRIVSTSLWGIFMHAELLNPFRYGLFSLRLLSNKVMRRVLPVLLVMFLAGNVPLYSVNPFFRGTLLLQGAFYSLALLHRLILNRTEGPGLLRRASSVAYYFCVGNYGALLGLTDFLLGRRIEKWDPVKSD